MFGMTWGAKTITNNLCLLKESSNKISILDEKLRRNMLLKTLRIAMSKKINNNRIELYPSGGVWICIYVV